jgi:hypothetical protein
MLLRKIKGKLQPQNIYHLVLLAYILVLKTITGEPPEKFHAFCGTLKYIIVIKRL